MALQLNLAMVLVIVQIRYLSETKLLKLAGSEHGNQSYAAGILDNSLAIGQGDNVSWKSQQELVSMNCRGLLCQLLDEFAAVEAEVEVSPR